jgi:hypothetical protein
MCPPLALKIMFINFLRISTDIRARVSIEANCTSTPPLMPVERLQYTPANEDVKRKEK